MPLRPLPLLRSLHAAVFFLFLSVATGTWALDPPKGAVVLSVSGKVLQTNKDGRADFDMAMLESLPQKSFSTHTPWHTGAVQFTGPLLRDVLAAVNARGTKIVAKALNDYRTEIPFDDPQKEQVIVARLMNGKPMPVRDKGPLFIIYPFDDKPALRTELYYNRSAWQLRSLTIE